MSARHFEDAEQEAVALTLHRADDALYGREIAYRTDEVSRSGVYVVLGRMHQVGLVSRRAVSEGRWQFHLTRKGEARARKVAEQS